MKIFQVDAFTREIFKGNPAGVCLFVNDEPDVWLQNMAAEMNLSETAFVKKTATGFNLRWFTPKKEVDLCGHATLATAHILWETGALTPGQSARFDTLSGLLIATKNGDWIQLDFPREEDSPAAPPEELLAGLKILPQYVGTNRMDYLVEVESENMVRNLSPDFSILSKIDTRGIIVTSKSADPQFDFVSRFFGPVYGIDEDPVTGSAHCCLGPYWKRKLGKDEFTAYQASARGGVLKIKVGETRVYISGQAKTVFHGEVN